MRPLAILILASLIWKGYPVNGSLSAPCSESIVALASQAREPTCVEPITLTLNSTERFSECTKQIDGVDCMNPYSIMGHVGSPANPILYPKSLVPKSVCPLCEPDFGLLAACNSLIGDVIAIINGKNFNESDYEESGLMSVVSNISAFCSSDTLLISLLRYQSSVVCASGSSFGYSITPYNTLDNVLDMRYLTQCGTCGMIPCLPGQLCKANELPVPCPGGYYCPDSTEAIKCPKGYYCPISSAFPIKCHSLGFSTCPEGSEREVVWIPLIWSLGIVILFVLATRNGPKLLMDVIGYERQAKKSFSGFLGGLPQSGVAQADELKLSPVSVEITFTGVDLITRQVKRLQNISGTIRSGRFTAIMGASGAGKTTFMNALMGKELITSGTVAYRDSKTGQRIAAKNLRSSIAFVPQDDVLLREMTVEQLLYQSAAWRLPISMTAEEKTKQVEDVITKMKLTSIRQTVVGGGESSKAGISPGDRKSVNIAMELVSKPACIYLDEPTTNLDASSALNVATIVSSLARLNMTCVAVVHQPRREIFELIDDLILLVPGGRIAYNGPANRAVEWFAHIGYPLIIPEMNIADFVIDLTSNNFEACGITRDTNDKPVDWSLLWLEKGENFLMNPKTSTAITTSTLALPDAARESSIPCENVVNADTGIAQVTFEEKPGFISQFMTFGKIALIQEIKEDRLVMDCVTHLLAGCILGIVNAGGSLLIPPLPDTYNMSCPPESYETCLWMMRYQLGPATFYITALLGIVVVPSAVRAFGREKTVFKRNYDVGANTMAYFCGKSIVNMLLTVPKVICFVSPILAIAAWSAPFEYFLGLFIAISICLGGLSYVMSMLLWNPDVAILVMTIYCIVVNLLGGFVPLLGEGYLPYVFHARWSARAIVTSELIYGRKFSEELYNAIFDLPWRHPDFRADVMVLMIMAIAFHALAAALLYRRALKK